ncbi:MAG: hypothetical protein J07HR59_01183 [Halorubrum sp. J07HR59]|nr:MAG: hypothetical protein J07HR59_01183 [Halorubrum sp. J07HR59]
MEFKSEEPVNIDNTVTLGFNLASIHSACLATLSRVCSLSGRWLETTVLASLGAGHNVPQ